MSYGFRGKRFVPMAGVAQRCQTKKCMIEDSVDSEGWFKLGRKPGSKEFASVVDRTPFPLATWRRALRFYYSGQESCATTRIDSACIAARATPTSIIPTAKMFRQLSFFSGEWTTHINPGAEKLPTQRTTDATSESVGLAAGMSIAMSSGTIYAVTIRAARRVPTKSTAWLAQKTIDANEQQTGRCMRG
jgi:hypothetical protein